MKRYEIIDTGYNDYNFIIFSTSYITPFKCLEEINSELIETNRNDFLIVFDLLMNLGNSSDRYVEAFFNGKELVKDSFKVIDISKKHDLRMISCQFFQSKPELLKRSILNSAQRLMLNKGIAI